MTIDEAFQKFKSRLELTDGEQKDASKRQIRAREIMSSKFHVEDDFLAGSYARHTKTKPLKDVDIFVVLGSKERHRLDKPSKELLEAVCEALAPEYGEDKVSIGRRCVQVRFGEAEDDKVMSIDVVPAFSEGENYKIADPQTEKDWAVTNPKSHAAKATACNKDFDLKWKSVVKMAKKWNEFKGKPIKPSFLIEVMAIDLLKGPFSGGYPYELKALFAALEARISETWNDPAGLGPPVSDRMDADACQNARTVLAETGKSADRAIQLAKAGNVGSALRIWRDEVFGSRFSVS